MLLSHVWLFVTPLTVAHQVPLSLKFSRQEYWSRVSFPSPGDLSNPGIELLSPALAGRLFTVWATREALSPSVLLSKVASWAEISISSSRLACDIRHFDGKNPPAMQETQIWSLHQEDPLEKVMTFHSSILAWRIPWTEEPGGLQSMGCKSQIWLLITHTHSGYWWCWRLLLMCSPGKKHPEKGLYDGLWWHYLCGMSFWNVFCHNYIFQHSK